MRKRPITNLVLSLLVPWIALASASPIHHVVIVMMENHSFDSVFGTFPGANGATFGNAGGTMVPLNHLNDQPPSDYDHTRDGARIDIDGGKMDAFNRHNCSTAPYWLSLIHI